VVRKIVEEVRQEPKAKAELLSKYLPVLLECAMPYLADRKGFARFRYALLVKWRTVFGEEIPPPSFEGVYDYETMVSRMYQHVAEYRERVPKVLRLWGIYPTVEVEAMVKTALMDVLFSAVLDVLRYAGDVV